MADCPSTWVDKLPDWLVAAGTLSAVVVALWQSQGARKESASKTYFERAESAIRVAVQDFLARTDDDGGPVNDRRHWLNFARAIKTAQQLASRIEMPELKQVWNETEHYWRERVYDVLKPELDSYPADYYGYTTEADRIKNFAFLPKSDRAALSEASLVVVYRWVKWPENRPDSIDRNLKFTDEEIEKMELFGPRGLSTYVGILRNMTAPAQQAQHSVAGSDEEA